MICWLFIYIAFHSISLVTKVMPRVYDETEAGERKGGMEKEKEKKNKFQKYPNKPRQH